MKVEIITEFGDNELSVDNNMYYTDHLSPNAIDCIANAIKGAGYDVHIFGGIPQLIRAYSNQIPVDQNTLYFNISNGMTQPSRRMQAPVLCELLNMKYSGSAPFAVALMNNKHFTKKIIKDLIQTPRDILIDSPQNLEAKVHMVKKYPIIIKPNNEGGSYGIYQENVIYNVEDAIKKSHELLAKYQEILLEELIPGTEITNLIIGNKDKYLLNEIIAYRTYGKFVHNDLVRDINIKTQNISEMLSIYEYTTDDNLINDIKNTSIEIFEKIGCRDIARIDYKINLNGQLVFLEINSNPNLYAKYAEVICERNHFSYSDFLSLILKSASHRYHLL